jgi:hypothetical protein
MNFSANDDHHQLSYPHHVSTSATVGLAGCCQRGIRLGEKYVRLCQSTTSLLPPWPNSALSPTPWHGWLCRHREVLCCPAGYSFAISRGFAGIAGFAAAVVFSYFVMDGVRTILFLSSASPLWWNTSSSLASLVTTLSPP